MSRYIEREKALDAVLFALVGTGYQSKAIYAIKDVPTADVVEVVRCKDCFYSHFNTSSERYSCQREYPRRSVKEDDYCRYGRRREERK